MKTVFAMLIALCAAGAAAQSPAPQPPATPASQPPESKAAPQQRPLNLNLDDAAQAQRVGEMLQLIVATREFQRV